MSKRWRRFKAVTVTAVKQTLAARIVVVDPPTGVVFALQRGKGNQGRPVMALKADGRDLAFDFEISVVVTRGAAQYSGDFVQGKPGERFVYINSGTLAGHHESHWTRRAKIGLESLSASLIRDAVASQGVIEARFLGTGRDGGPSCATVPLIEGGWTIRDAKRSKEHSL
ncbi:MAG: DUF5990 family protein [Vicinamibacteria bacterium]